MKLIKIISEVEVGSIEKDSKQLLCLNYLLRYKHLMIIITLWVINKNYPNTRDNSKCNTNNLYQKQFFKSIKV